MDPKKIRAELVDLAADAATASTGVRWQRYSSTPGAATIPAVIAGFAEPITFDGSYTLARATWPVHLCVSPQYSADLEAQLLTAALAAGAAFDDAGPVDDAWLQIRFVEIRDTGLIQIANNPALSTTVFVELLAERPTQGDP